MHISKRLLTTLIASLFVALGTGETHAEFALNWTPLVTPSAMGMGDGGSGYINCNRGGTSYNCGQGGGMGGGNDPDKTPFLQEIVSDGTYDYFHVITGLNGASSFAQEVFIRIQPGSNCINTECSYSGGRQGDSGSGMGGFTSNTSGNGWDPLRSDQTFTGNGTGDPTRMIMRQVLNDSGSGLTQEFLKSSYALKPKITQNITSTGMTAQFILDMSNSDYLATTTADNNKAGLMTNSLTLTGSNAPTQGNFDATATVESLTTINAPTPNITGGIYTYAPGTGWSGSTFNKGTYSYAQSGNANVTTLDWNTFRDPSDNLMNFGTTTSPNWQQRARGGDICKNTAAGTNGC
ncbi:MAG: hypothetical protein ACOY4D_10370 [Pseudomonadota bacterium]